MPNNATRFTAVLKLIYARAATSLSSWPQTWESAAFAILCGAVKATVLVDNFRLSPADSRGAGGRCCIGDDGELWCVQGKVELSGIYPPWGAAIYDVRKVFGWPLFRTIGNCCSIDSSSVSCRLRILCDKQIVYCNSASTGQPVLMLHCLKQL